MLYYFSLFNFLFYFASLCYMKLNNESIQNSDIGIFGNWLDTEPKLLKEPFNHIIIDNFLKEKIFNEVSQSLSIKEPGPLCSDSNERLTCE